jgi:DNA repair protein RecN (Recombination protein N)
MAWETLSLRNLGVIDSAELELGPGFSVITGETGAGKTMVVTALGLLRGARADSGLVRSGSEQARVEAIVAVPAGSAVAELVDNAGGSVEDGVVVLSRALSAQGRSRAFVGGAAAPATLLSTITDELVAVHGQSDQFRLLRSAEQLTALDVFGGDSVAKASAAYRPVHQRLRSVEERLTDLTLNQQERARELDELRHGLAEIDGVEPQAGEDEALLAEEGRLAHAEALIRAAHLAHEALAGESGAGRDAVAAAAVALQEAAGHDPVLDALTERVRGIAVELDDVGTELSSYASGIDADPARLAGVQSRIAALTRLKRKFGPTLDEVLQWADKAAVRVGDLDLDDEAIAGLEQERRDLLDQSKQFAADLHQARIAAAARLESLIGEELTQLSMPSARLSVEVEPTDQLRADGSDDVAFLFAANSGMDPRPLAKGASGGELSRVMLALEVVLADRTTVPTLVFDEVDAGIGGKAAVEVGRRLAKLAETAQVLAVTHLPQVAAFADSHFRVLKDDDGNVTSSTVVRLGGDARIDELARMLAGQEDSAAAQAHARELLELAGKADRAKR